MLFTQLSLAMATMFTVSSQDISGEVICQPWLHKDRVAKFTNTGTTDKTFNYLSQAGVDDQSKIIIYSPVPENVRNELLNIFASQPYNTPLASVWSYESRDFTERRTNQWAFIVDPGCTTEVYQIVGQCGNFIVYVKDLIVYNYDSNGNLITEETYGILSK